MYAHPSLNILAIHNFARPTIANATIILLCLAMIVNYGTCQHHWSTYSVLASLRSSTMNHSTIECIAEEILGGCDKCKDTVTIRSCTYLVQVPNIPDGDDVFMYRLHTPFQTHTKEQMSCSYCCPILCKVQ